MCLHCLGLAVALATASYWTFTFLINEITPYILGSTSRFFYIVAGISFLSIFLVLFALPETKVRQLPNNKRGFFFNHCIIILDTV